MSGYITSIATANPKYKIKQSDIVDFMIQAHGLDQSESERLHVLYRATSIDYRYSVIPDYQQSERSEFYNDTAIQISVPTTSQRLKLYKKEALSLSVSAIEKAFSQIDDFDKSSITHLITVSCTGMSAPGLDLQLVKELGLNSTVKRTAINFMGCYAAFNGIKVAETICSSTPQAKVLVVCTELCSLHFQLEKTEDNLLANSLFGDGSAALIMQTEAAQGINMKPESFYCDIFDNGEDEMAWAIGDHGFEMKLSEYVPTVIESGISKIIKRFAPDNQYDFYAIHPGGKKILQVIEQELGISIEKNKYSRSVLRHYGNMSSPTFLFVLKQIWNTLNEQDQAKDILGMAFGPGITFESMVLKIAIH